MENQEENDEKEKKLLLVESGNNSSIIDLVYNVQKQISDFKLEYVVIDEIQEHQELKYTGSDVPIKEFNDEFVKSNWSFDSTRYIVDVQVIIKSRTLTKNMITQKINKIKCNRKRNKIARQTRRKNQKP